MIGFAQAVLLRCGTTAVRRTPFSIPRRDLHKHHVPTSHRWHSALPGASTLVWGATLAAVLTGLAIQPAISLDSDVFSGAEDVTIDKSTSITFPNTLQIQSKTPLPTFTLIGVGARSVSFLGIRVYSVGFYADLSNPNLKIPATAPPQEKIEHIVRNTACVLRIVPTRATSYTHLRDGFMRALQARLILCRQRGQLGEAEEVGTQSPLRKFKSMFPNTRIDKHTPLDVLILAPEKNQPRTMIVRDLGSLQNDWVAQEFVLAYFEGKGLSPPMKDSVVEGLRDFGN